MRTNTESPCILVQFYHHVCCRGQSSQLPCFFASRASFGMACPQLSVSPPRSATSPASGSAVIAGGGMDAPSLLTVPMSAAAVSSLGGSTSSVGRREGCRNDCLSRSRSPHRVLQSPAPRAAASLDGDDEPSVTLSSCTAVAVSVLEGASSLPLGGHSSLQSNRHVHDDISSHAAPIDLSSESADDEQTPLSNPRHCDRLDPRRVGMLPPVDTRRVLAELGFPETVEAWAQQQDVYFGHHPPLPAGWIRIWPRSQDVNYYLCLANGRTTWEWPGMNQ